MILQDAEFGGLAARETNQIGSSARSRPVSDSHADAVEPNPTRIRQHLTT